MWVKPSGQTLLPLYLLSSLLLTSTQVVQFELYLWHLYSCSCLRHFHLRDENATLRDKQVAWPMPLGSSVLCQVLPRQKRTLTAV